ncbi:MAG: NAD(P)-binding protein [Rubrivivax sp.]|nr:NAD(P)-binding protein [Rubrivivax sp.]
MAKPADVDDRAADTGRPITRRDFLDGVSIAVGSAAVGALAATGPTRAASPTDHPAGAVASSATGASARPAGPAATDAPPRRQGLRGFEPAAMEAGHALRDGRGIGAIEDTGEAYDLVIVGAGMSGLAAAHFYREQRPGATVLVLDACDDFGGHARRVEFEVDGRQLLVCGGTQELWNVNTFSPESLRLIEAIGIDRARYARHRAADKDALEERGLGAGTFFNAESYGVDRLVVADKPLGRMTPAELRSFHAKTPLPAHVQAGLERLYLDRTDPMAALTMGDKVGRLRTMSYTDYLLQVRQAHPDVVDYIAAGWGNDMDSSSAGFDTMSAWSASRSYPLLFAGLGLPKVTRRSNVAADVGEMIQFPDGGAGVARLLIRHLIPDALPGRTAEDSIRAELRYDRLDRPGQDARIRLRSTVLRASHVGDVTTADEVEVVYRRDGRAQRVRAGAVVMACFNAIVPYLVPELPERQKSALKLAVRKAQARTFVAIRNWRAFDKLGVYSINSRGMYFSGMSPWIMPEWGGAYANARTPDEPIVLMLNLSRHVLEHRNPALPPRERWKAARATLQGIPFETFEREVRRQLQRMLGPGGFDAANDIAGITVCRWGHGYAGGTNELYDPDWSQRPDAPWVVGRQRFGRIAIANSDAAATSLTNAAFAQGHRAVMEIVNDIQRPVYDFRWSERDVSL